MNKTFNKIQLPNINHKASITHFGKKDRRPHNVAEKRGKEGVGLLPEKIINKQKDEKKFEYKYYGGHI